MNVVLQDFDESVRHLQNMYDAEFVVDIPQTEMHACLVETGRVLFELFFPHAYLLNSRYGPHYLGVEYQANMEVVRQAVAERGMRIVRDTGIALHTHPADGFGASYEFYHDEFHQRDWPLLGGKFKSAEYWLSHPLGLTGQKGYTHAVNDIEAASAFVQSFLGGKPAYEESRPAIAARALGLQVGDVIVELLTPAGDGEVARHLYHYGDGIRSTVFGVSNIDRAKRFLAERGLPTVPGGAPGAIAVPAEANLGVIFEFAE
jgi:catechol 2,3-dioxygenase-like lactoylglutathione lyase family enzyme